MSADDDSDAKAIGKSGGKRSSTSSVDKSITSEVTILSKPLKQRAAKRRKMEEASAAKSPVVSCPAVADVTDDNDQIIYNEQAGDDGGKPSRKAVAAAAAATSASVKSKVGAKEGRGNKPRKAACRRGYSGARGQDRDDSGDTSSSDSSDDEFEEDEGEVYVASGGEADEEGEGNEEAEGESSDDNQQMPLKVNKILSRKSLNPAEWRDFCKDMNTDQVCRGEISVQLAIGYRV